MPNLGRSRTFFRWLTMNRSCYGADSLGYTEVKGLPILRNEIAKLYQGLELENVVCFAGAEEGIFCGRWTSMPSKMHSRRVRDSLS